MRTAAIALACAVAGGLVGGGTVALVDGGADDDGRPAGSAGPVVRQAPVGGAEGGLTPAEIYRRDAPGVVYITAEVVRQEASPFDVFPEERRGVSTGSGFLIDADGAILTNAHVVEDAQRVTVRLADGATLPARVRGRDPSTDLALLAVEPGARRLRPLELGTSRAVQVGDPTVAIGNPFGLDLTLTTGVVSAKQRRIDAPNGFQIDDVIQTDAAINPGNSGGPLIDANGRVIGINSAIRTGEGGGGSVGIGFAVPIDTARRILPQLRRAERVERPWLGLTSATVTSDEQSGAYVQDVAPDGPAAAAGIAPGDVVVGIDGTPVTSAEDVTTAVEARRPGQRVRVELLRGGERRTVEAELARRPDTVGP